jgi:hypothetical protein
MGGGSPRSLISSNGARLIRLRVLSEGFSTIRACATLAIPLYERRTGESRGYNMR